VSSKRYYWLKLNENFFEDDTIQWLEEQENGKDYVLFYLKLALKSLSDEGHLIRYVGEKLIPYDIKALAKLTNTPVDTVSVAMKVFLDIGLVSSLDTGEIYMNQINEMIGSETDVAKRVRKHRAKKLIEENKNIRLLQCNTDETKCNTEIDIEIDKDIDIEKESKGKSKRFSPPSINEIQDYCEKRNNNVDASTFFDFYESKGWYVGKNKMKDWKAAVRTWEKRDGGGKDRRDNEPSKWNLGKEFFTPGTV